MSNDEFTKLFNYMSERFDKVDNSLQGKAESTDLHTALGLLDSLSKRLEISDD